MKHYEPTIGLEIHAELNTKTKMFCDCTNDPDEKHPNENVCPVCLGHPGALPTVNKKAVESVIRVGLALGAEINPITKFDRKNYFYPDLPKGYQISQYDEPLVKGGTLHGVVITRVHLEEDVGRSQHNGGDTLIDYNRSSIPLMELVTEPVIHSADEAVSFARELQLLLRYLGVSDADMEKGNMRIEANVSIHEPGKGFGTKVEVKNINSFRAVHDAIEYELKRQEEVLKKGEKIHQETRGWNEDSKKSFSQRSKESAHDYRYFPEPDLPPFETSIFGIEELKRHLPELPWQKRERLQKEYKLSAAQADLLASDKQLADYFEAAASELGTRDEADTALLAKKTRELLFNYLTSDLLGLLNQQGISFDELRVTPERLAHLVALIDEGRIGSRQAKDILPKMLDGTDPAEILVKENLETISDESELGKIIEEVIAENPNAVADYKKGKTVSLQFMIGKAMGKLRGRGHPDTLKSVFENLLNKK